MPKSRNPKAAQRKLDFAAAPPASTETDEDEVVVDEEQTREANRKRPALASQTIKDKKRAKTKSTAAATPNKGTTAGAALVTPAEATAQKKAEKKDEGGDGIEDYVPTYIHKNLDYHRKGMAADSLPPKTLKAFELITKHYIIPRNLEQSRSYGPLSGSTYEQRVISAYRLGKLEAVDEPAAIICTACVEIGHDRDYCPSLL